MGALRALLPFGARPVSSRCAPASMPCTDAGAHVQPKWLTQAGQASVTTISPPLSLSLSTLPWGRVEGARHDPALIPLTTPAQRSPC